MPPAAVSEGREAGEEDNGGWKYTSWVWPPCESLLYGTAFEAAAIAEHNRREPCPESFSGSLHDGVDVRATLRAITRGERRIQVKVKSATGFPSATEEGRDEPMVFIFEPEDSGSGGEWETLLACEGRDIRRFVRNTARFDQVAERQGDVFVASVHFSAEREPGATLQKVVTGLYYLYGIVVFGSNPCLTPRQAARWLEGSGYGACPIMRHYGVDNVFDLYQREHNLSLDRNRWAESLIRFAIPYAQQRVTVMLPKAQSISTTVLREAAARKIRLEFVSSIHFPKQRIDAIRHQYLVRPDDVDTMAYSEEIEAAFGESTTTHLDLLPERIRAQLDPDT